MRTRAPIRYANSDHRFDDLPLRLVEALGLDGHRAHFAYFNHMHQWEGPTGEGSSSGWTLSGVTTVATIAPRDDLAGVIRLTADATLNADPALALGSATAGAFFRYAKGRRIAAFARLALASDVVTTEFFFGLGTPDTQPTVTNTLPSDGIFLEKGGSGTVLDFHARKDGISTERTGIVTGLTISVFAEIGLLVDALGNIHAYQDGVRKDTILAGTANIPSAAADILQFIIGARLASALVDIDWLLLYQDNATA